MALIKNDIKPSTKTIDKFLGLNLTGETRLKLGESGNMNNFYITNNFGLSKIEGYKQIMSTVASNKTIQGMWYGKLGSTYHFLFACNGHVYKITNGYWDVETAWDNGAFTTHTTDLGILTDATTRFFAFADKVYIVNGNEYKYWNGTGSIADVVGYIPKVYIGTEPSGGGVAFEEINNLIGKKHQTFNADGISTIYQLAETSLVNVDSVYVNGVLQTLTTHYTVSISTGKVTFVTAPATGLDNVDIYWTKNNNDRTTITKNRAFCLFGISNDTRVFLYGNTTAQNRVIYSGLANGIPSVEYFPATYFNDVGSINSAVTDIRKQYDKMIITTDKPDAYYSYYDAIEVSTEDTTTSIVSFPVFQLNESKGNVAFAQGQLIDNTPYTISNIDIIMWKATSVVNERNADIISERITKDLKDLDLTKALTLDFEFKTEYWLCVDRKVYIYNYMTDTFSKLTLLDTPTCFLIIDNELYFGTDSGLIMKHSGNFTNFNGAAIASNWDMNFYDFDAAYLQKTMNKLWVSMLPQYKASADIAYTMDRDVPVTPQHIQYYIITFDDVDFSNYSFNINLNPQPFYVKLKAKKFTYLKITIDNKSLTDTCIILSLTMRVEYGNESNKRR